MIFETEIGSIGLPRRSKQFCTPYRVPIPWYVHRGSAGYISPHLTKISSSKFQIRCENNISNSKAEMVRVHDTSAAHSDISKELGMEKYCSELILTDWKQDNARKAKRKSDVLGDNIKEGRNTNESMNALSRSWYSCTRCWNSRIQIQTSLNLNLLYCW